MADTDFATRVEEYLAGLTEDEYTILTAKTRPPNGPDTYPGSAGAKEAERRFGKKKTK